jgi:predicted RNase H-like HicB family nuclease
MENQKPGAIMKLQVVIHPAEEGGFWAEIPALAGCVSEGETLEETLLNIEAAEGWLEVAGKRIKSNS